MDIARDALGAASAQEAEAIIREDAPDKFLIYGDQIQRNLSKIFKPKRRPFSARPLSSFNYPSCLDDWYYVNVPQPRPERPKSLVIVGRSRLGKTQLARAFGPHIYVQGMWCVNDFMGWNWDGYVVWDDIQWDSFKNSYKQWMGAQSDFWVTDKYQKKVWMAGGAPSILLLNPPEWEKYKDDKTGWDKDWAVENVLVLQIEDTLY